MFGNLFNQEKANSDSNQQGQQPVQGNSMQQSSMPQNQTQYPQPPMMPQQPYPPPAQTYPFQGYPQQMPQPPQQMGMQNMQQQNIPTNQQGVSSSGEGMSEEKKQNVAALSKLDERSKHVLQTATEEAKRIKQQFIQPDQLLYGLIQDKEIVSLLKSFNLDPEKLAKDIQEKSQPGYFEGQPMLSESTRNIFESAHAGSKKRDASFIAPEDILLALFDSVEKEYLKTQGLEKEKIQKNLSKNSEFALGRRSVLEKFGIDLTEQAKTGKLDPITGRDKEIERLVHILLRRTKNNPIIIGEAGVGKTAIVEGVAQQIVSGQVPQQLQGRKIIQLDLSSLIAGASHRGEFEDRLRNVIKEVQVAEGKIILFIDEIHTVIGAGDSGGALDASNIIKPYLARGQLQLIGTTTTAEYRKYFEKDKAFQRRFQPVNVPEPEEEVAIKMLETLKPKYEKFHNVVFAPDALQAAVKLSKKYVGERFLPDKGVDLMDEAASEVKLKVGKGEAQNNTVTQADIEKIVSSWTGIPITKLTEDESQKLLNLEDLIHKRLIDQEEAVAAVSEAVRRGRIGLASANRPIASFIFLGPTGVGKTELAKTLAEIMFGRDDATIRLDMSEYMEKHEVAKLIGAPPGYVGYEEGGQLTEAVRNKPYSIVLLDEVEKAHPDVFNILLQLLEDGRLTDNKGNTISFKNTIIIATSNIGSSVIQKHLLEKQKENKEETKNSQSQSQPQQPSQAQQSSSQQDAPQNNTSHQKFQAQSQQNDNKPKTKEEKDYQELTKILLEELHKFFKPELLNRFDELVLFKPLAREHMIKIARIGIGKTQKLLKEQGYNLEVTENALAQLAKDGYDPIYGARPLRRLIQSSVENPLAIHIISQKAQKGDTLLVDYNAQTHEYVFSRKATQPGQQSPPGGQNTQQASPQQPTQQMNMQGQIQSDQGQQGAQYTPPQQHNQQNQNGFYNGQTSVQQAPNGYTNGSTNPQSSQPTSPPQTSNGAQMQPQNTR